MGMLLLVNSPRKSMEMKAKLKGLWRNQGKEMKISLTDYSLIGKGKEEIDLAWMKYTFCLFEDDSLFRNSVGRLSFYSEAQKSSQALCKRSKGFPVYSLPTPLTKGMVRVGRKVSLTHLGIA